MTSTDLERQIVEANLDLIERLLRQTHRHRHPLVDEFRSRANFKLFQSARYLATKEPECSPEAARNYVARAILRSFQHVKRTFRVSTRAWAPLEPALEAGYHPHSRECRPDALAEIHEVVAATGIRTRGVRRELGRELTARLHALIRADPARNNAAIAREFFAATRFQIHVAAVRHHRAKLGLPPSQAKGGAQLHRRRRDAV